MVPCSIDFLINQIEGKNSVSHTFHSSSFLLLLLHDSRVAQNQRSGRSCVLHFYLKNAHNLRIMADAESKCCRACERDPWLNRANYAESSDESLAVISYILQNHHHNNSIHGGGKKSKVPFFLVGRIQHTPPLERNIYNFLSDKSRA